MSALIPLLLLSQVGTGSVTVTRPEVAFTEVKGSERHLHLAALLEALDRAYPPLAAAARKVEAARGEQLSAEGAFDLKVKGKAGYDPLGFYDAAQGELTLEQSTPLWGLRLFGGYRYGEDFPVYGAKSVTGQAGEVRAGLVLPLWRNGPIDGARLGIELAELGVDVASLELEVKRLAAYEKASQVYFKWLAAGLKLAIDQGMLTLAEARRGFVERRVTQGALAPIERIDNERLVVSRQAAVAAAEGRLARAVLAISLFLRDGEGRVRRPERDLLPASFPEVEAPTQDKLRRALARGLEQRPELARLQRRREGLLAQQRFFENQRAPAVDVGLAVSKDLGDKRSYGSLDEFTSKGETELGLSLALAWPVQQRKARGKAAAVEAKLDQLGLQRRFLEDAIEVQVRDAYARLLAAHARSALALQAYELTRQLEAAERRRLELGQTTILLVNLREEATAKAAKEVVDGLTDYHSARAAMAVAAGGRPG